MNTPHPPHWSTALEAFLSSLRGQRFGILTDFDGTLVRFRPHPDTPSLSPRMAQLAATLTERLPLFSLISGRGAPELLELANVPGAVYVGNHGLEELKGDDLHVAPEATAWAERLTTLHAQLGEPTIPGVLYHNKRVTMSITYRRAADPATARMQLKTLLDEINQDYGFELFEGRYIWELKPPIHLNKGTAVARLIEEYQLDGAIFMGDDLTDIPGLEMIRELRALGRIKGLAVAVLGETEVPAVPVAGDVIAHHVEDVEELLAAVNRLLG
jgi:trehalose 6-phosphate phosphatase